MALSAEVSSVMSSMVGIRESLERVQEQMHESTASTSSNPWSLRASRTARRGGRALALLLLQSGQTTLRSSHK